MMKYLACILTIGLAACSQPTERTVESRVPELPYYNEATFTPIWTIPEDGFHHISGFELYNQLGDTITAQDLNGKICVADFFFATCPGICPQMMENMGMVQEEFLNDDEILLLSHSVTPEQDSVGALRRYAKQKGVVNGKWHLLTGNQSVIYDLGRKDYFVEEDLGLQKDDDEFLHTENFVLIDKKRRIRGIYNGLRKGAVKQLIADIKTLKLEETSLTSE